MEALSKKERRMKVRKEEGSMNNLSKRSATEGFGMKLLEVMSRGFRR